MAHPLGGPTLGEKPLAEHGLGEKYAGSRHVGVLPMGCIQCREGAKLVLFITGLCDKECFYCPVSRDKMYRDVMFANERPIHAGDWSALLDECRLIDAKGAGITGGDPMVVPDRVIEALQVMKREFGPHFHTHLYTSCAFDTAWIAKLKGAGLDEIRFHPDSRDYADMAKSWHDAAIREALRVGLTTTIEIPCIPGKADDILALAVYLRDVGAHGLNLNELEFSDPNIANLKRFGYKPANDETQSVAGSRDTALEVLDRWKAMQGRTSKPGEQGKVHPTEAPGTAPIPMSPTATRRDAFAVHFCSSPYKDAIQLMQRFRRRAANVARPFEEQGEEGTLTFGVLTPKPGVEVGEVAERLRGEYEVPAEWVAVLGGRVETAPWVAEELADDEDALDDLGVTAYLSEVHPTADRVEVERTPLPPRDLGAQAA